MIIIIILIITTQNICHSEIRGLTNHYTNLLGYSILKSEQVFCRITEYSLYKRVQLSFFDIRVLLIKLWAFKVYMEAHFCKP